MRDRPFLALLVILVISVNAPLLTRYPAPGGDEASFVDAAVTLATQGYLGGGIHQGLLPGIERHVYWQPPLYFVAFAGWFTLVGVGLLQARSFSLICGVFLVIGVYVLSRRYARPGPSAIAATICAISAAAGGGARFARMNTFCVALTLWCVICYLRARDSRRPALFGACGVLAALAVLSHPLGLVAIVIVSITMFSDTGQSRIDRVTVYPVVGCFICGLAPWVAYILRDPQSFHLQMAAQFARKLSLGSYWYQFWIARTHAMGLIVVLVAGFWVTVSRWRASERVIPLGFVFSFAAATYGRETGYFVYFYSWGWCAVAVLLNDARVRRSLLYAVVALAFVSEAAILGYNMWRYRNRDYESLARVVRKAVPPGSSVFIGFPEVSPYFALLGRNPMRAAVPVRTSNPHAHVDAARTSDFIAASMPVLYLPEVAALLNGVQPIAVVDQGPGYRLAIFRTPGGSAEAR